MGSSKQENSSVQTSAKIPSGKNWNNQYMFASQHKDGVYKIKEIALENNQTTIKMPKGEILNLKTGDTFFIPTTTSKTF